MTRAAKAGILAACLAMAAPSVVTADHMMIEWDRMISQGCLISGNTPPTSTHYISIVNTAMYEAWAAYDPIAVGPVFGNRYDGTGGDNTESNRREAASHAAYHALMKMTPALEDDYRALMRSFGYEIEDQTAPALLGKRIGIEIVDHHKGDGSNWENNYIDTTNYQPKDPSDPTAFQPLYINGVMQVPIAPHWKNIEPFGMKTADQLRPPPPAAYGTPEWDAQIEELLEMSANLTNYQKASLEWWLPPWGPPPLLHCEIDRDYSNRHNTTFDQDMKSYFVSHNAMYDASIVAWESKYYYDYVRPVTAIRNLGDRIINVWGGPGEGTIPLKASEFIPYQVLDFVTPPFPEYVSGHSTFAGAWAEAMTRLLGPELDHKAVVDYLIIEGIHLDPPEVIEHKTWWDASYESGIGRLWGGVHFHDANVNGQEYGKRAGVLVHERATNLFEGNPCRDFNLLNLAAPMGLTNLSLLQGKTTTNGNDIDGFVGVDSRRNTVTVVGTETGGWDLSVDERGQITGLVDVAVLDDNGTTITTVSVPLKGRTVYMAQGDMPGRVHFRTGLMVTGSTGSGANATALKMVVMRNAHDNVENLADLISVPGSSPLTGQLVVKAGRHAQTVENVEVHSVAAEMACLSAEDLERQRRNLYTGDAHLLTPSTEREGGDFRIGIAPGSRRSNTGQAIARAQNGNVRAAARASHELIDVSEVSTEQFEAMPLRKLAMSTPGAAVVLNVKNE